MSKVTYCFTKQKTEKITVKDRENTLVSQTLNYLLFLQLKILGLKARPLRKSEFNCSVLSLQFFFSSPFYLFIIQMS